MAKNESIVVLDIQAEGAVKSVNDLKNNIKALKDNLGDLEVGTEEYQNTLNELKVNQNALKDAMYASSTSMEDVKKAATGTSESYNSLVHRMAALKEEWRAVDTSTEQGKQRFKDLSVQINDVNEKLKAMDAGVGNYQRNVGNYESALKNFHSIVKDLPKPLSAVKEKLDVVDKSMGVMAVNPIIGIVALLSPILKEIVTSLKENDSAMESIKKSMTALQPIMDFFSGIMEKMAGLIVDIVSKVSEFLGSSGLINQIIQGVMGVGNAILQFVIAPFKGVVAAIKVFQEEGISGFRNASKAFAEEMKNGVSFKNNFEAGQAVADALVSGVKDKKPTMEDAGKESAEAFVLKFKETAEPGMKEIFDNVEKILKERDWDPFKITQDLMDEELDAINADIDEQAQQMIEADKKMKKSAEDMAKARVATLYSVANATSSILGSIADMYEADEKNSEANAEKVKALRIAESTINTITGAIGAFTQASATIPPPFGQIVGAISAAAVTASGIAQIAQIRKTNAKGGSSPTPSAPASVSAPTIPTDIPTIRTATSASEEERLNQMASSQRVYILQSDIEAANNQSRTQVAETTFA